MKNTLAVVVFSGGLDSATALAVAYDRHGRDNTRAISFDYGQKHKVELECAAAFLDDYGVPHTVVKLNPDPFKGGVLTTDEEIVDMRYDDLPDGVMSPTYVPFRNGNLLSMGAAYADSLLREAAGWQVGQAQWESAYLYAGMHSEDAAGFAYADCTPEFLGAMASAIIIGTYGRVRLQAIFQHMTKEDIIRMGLSLSVQYEKTHSCYRGERPACGACSTCHARLEAFDKVGLPDPLKYAEVIEHEA